MTAPQLPQPASSPSSASSPSPSSGRALPPGAARPGPRSVPAFDPVRPRRGRRRLRRALRRRRPVLAAALAVAAASLALAVPRPAQQSSPPTAEGATAAGTAGTSRPAQDSRRAPPRVSAPVRIADAGAARLLEPGDVVDVLAAPAEPSAGAAERARVVARRARVAEVPAGEETAPRDEARGALLVLDVPRTTAADLAAAGAGAQLTVTRW